MSGMFYGCSSLTNINLSNFNTNNVTNMSCMFYRCSSLTNISITQCAWSKCESGADFLLFQYPNLQNQA